MSSDIVIIPLALPNWRRFGGVSTGTSCTRTTPSPVI